MASNKSSGFKCVRCGEENRTVTQAAIITYKFPCNNSMYDIQDRFTMTLCKECKELLMHDVVYSFLKQLDC